MNPTDLDMDDRRLFQTAWPFAIRAGAGLGSDSTLITHGIVLATYLCQTVIIFSRNQYTLKGEVPGVEEIDDQTTLVNLNLVNNAGKLVSYTQEKTGTFLEHVDTLLQKKLA